MTCYTAAAASETQRQPFFGTAYTIVARKYESDQTTALAHVWLRIIKQCPKAVIQAEVVNTANAVTEQEMPFDIRQGGDEVSWNTSDLIPHDPDVVRGHYLLQLTPKSSFLLQNGTVPSLSGPAEPQDGESLEKRDSQKVSKMVLCWSVVTFPRILMWVLTMSSHKLPPIIQLNLNKHQRAFEGVGWWWKTYCICRTVKAAWRIINISLPYRKWFNLLYAALDLLNHCSRRLTALDFCRSNFNSSSISNIFFLSMFHLWFPIFVVENNYWGWQQSSRVIWEQMCSKVFFVLF